MSQHDINKEGQRDVSAGRCLSPTLIDSAQSSALIMMREQSQLLQVVHLQTSTTGPSHEHTNKYTFFFLNIKEHTGDVCKIFALVKE